FERTAVDAGEEAFDDPAGEGCEPAVLGELGGVEGEGHGCRQAPPGSAAGSSTVTTGGWVGPRRPRSPTAARAQAAERYPTLLYPVSLPSSWKNSLAICGAIPIEMWETALLTARKAPRFRGSGMPT